MSKLKEKIIEGKEFIITFESVPGRGYKGGNIEEAIEFGRKAISSKLPIHAISITDNPGGNPAISPDVLAGELRSIGMDTLVHFACSNSNRNMIESRASALARSGLENLLVVTGDYPVSGYNGMAKPVFDLDSVQTIRYLKDMNKGLDVPGRKKGTFDKLAETNFFIGCAVSPFKKTEAELMTQFFKLEKKVAAGADFIIPQLGYDAIKFAEILKYMKDRNINVPIIGNVYVLTRPVARFMNKGYVPGCVVTDELLQKIEEEANAPDKGKEASLKRAAQLMAIFKGLKFNGAHIGGFGLKFEDVEFIIKQSEEIQNNWREYIPNFRYKQEGEYYCFPDVGAVREPPKQSLHFRMSKFCHHLAFTKEAPAYKTIKSIYELLEKWKFAGAICHFFERQIKRLLFDCQECGDCAIFDLAYLCPMSKCAKFQRNGPCGGSKNGMCEADNAKRCVWTLAYERFSSANNLDYIRKEYIPPVDCSLAKTSSWANFFMGRDHTGKK